MVLNLRITFSFVNISFITVVCFYFMYKNLEAREGSFLIAVVI